MILLGLDKEKLEEFGLLIGHVRCSCSHMDCCMSHLFGVFFRYFAARLNFNGFHSVLLNLPSYGSSLDNITCTNSN